MKFSSTMLLLLLTTVLMSSCSLRINTSHESAPASGTSSSAVDISFNSIILGITTEVDRASRTISVSSLPSGRIYSFSLLEDGDVAIDFDCTNLPDTARIVENRLHIDLGFADSLGTLELNCLTSNGALTINLGHESSSLAVVSSSFSESLSGVVVASPPAQTPDGLFSVWAETGRT